MYKHYGNDGFFFEYIYFRMIEKKRITDPDDLLDAMNKDASICCVKSKTTFTTTTRRKRAITPSESESSDDSSYSTKQKKKKSKSSENPKKGTENNKIIEVVVPVASTSAPKPISPVQVRRKNEFVFLCVIFNKCCLFIQAKKVIPKPKQPVRRESVAKAAPLEINDTSKNNANKTNDDQSAQIDCTPDLFSYLLDHSLEKNTAQSQPSSDNIQNKQKTAPPVVGNQTNRSNAISTNLNNPNQHSAPRSIRRNPASPSTARIVRRIPVPQSASHEPVYHNFDGYKIDLNLASAQSTLRLPNGKVLHVQKQSAVNPMNQRVQSRMITPSRNQPTQHGIQRLQTTPNQTFVPTQQGLFTITQQPPPQTRPLRHQAPIGHPSLPPPLVINNSVVHPQMVNKYEINRIQNSSSTTNLCNFLFKMIASATYNAITTISNATSTA